MEAPTLTPRSRILGSSSMFRFFRNLVGGKSSPKSSDKALARAWPCPSLEQEVVPLMVDRPATLPCALSVAMPKGSQHLPWHDPSGLGDRGAQTPTSVEILRVLTQRGEVISVLPRGSQEMLGHLSEKEEEEQEEEGEAAGEAYGNTGVSGRDHFAQSLEVEEECLQWAMGPLEVMPKAFTREEKECLLDGHFKLASSKAGATPWKHLLSLYKQFQKSAMAKFPFKEGLPHEEEKAAEGEEMEDEDNSFNLHVPGIVTLQSPLQKTFRSTDTVGFMESEVKKLLAVQRESHRWKTRSQDVLELLNRPQVTLEGAGIVGGQGHQAEGEGSCPPVFGECWGPGRGTLRQLQQHPKLEGRVQSPRGGVSRTEHLLLEEMDEMGNWPPE